MAAWEKDSDVANRESLAQEAMTHLDHLYRVAFHLARDRHKSQDMVQETFVRALASHQQFRSGSNMKAWLTKILYHLFFDDYDRQKRRRFQEEEPDTERHRRRPGRADNPGPESALLRKELGSEIGRCLENLPEEFRAPVVLVDLGDCSYQEAAAILACPVGTIRSRVSRGRRLMRRYLSIYITGKETEVERR